MQLKFGTIYFSEINFVNFDIQQADLANLAGMHTGQTPAKHSEILDRERDRQTDKKRESQRERQTDRKRET